VAFRLTVSETSDLTKVRIAGRLGNDAVSPVSEACAGARWPVVLDLSQATGASEAGVLLLRRLGRQGVRLVGASHYVTLLLEADAVPPGAPARPRRPRPRGPAAPRPGRRKGHRP
jgi:hypothetical protein